MKKIKVLGKVAAALAVCLVVLSFAMPVKVDSAVIINNRYTYTKIKMIPYMAQRIAVLHPKKNDLPYVKDLQADWCARFVSYVVGDPDYMYISSTANSVDMLKWYYNGRIIDGRPTLRDYDPHVGDLIFYDWQKEGGDMNVWTNWEHVGIITAIKRGEDGRLIFNTVEGNVNGEGWQNTDVSYMVNRNADWPDGAYIAGFATPYNANEKFSFISGDTTGNGKVRIDDLQFLTSYVYDCYHPGPNRVLPFWRWTGTARDRGIFLACDVNGDWRINKDDVDLLRAYIYR